MPNEASYDLILTSDDVRVGLMLDRRQDRQGTNRPRPFRRTSTALRRGEGLAVQEERAIYSDASGGAGYGERLASNVYLYGSPAYCRSPGTVMPPGRLTPITLPSAITGTVRAAFELGADLYVVAGQYAMRMTNGTVDPVIVQNLSAGGDFEGFSALTWMGHGYVGGTGQGIWRCDGTTRAWTQSADVRRKYLETVYWVRGNVGSQKLVGSSISGAVIYQWATSSILYTDNVNPMTEAVWSEEVQVGNAEYSITNLGASNQHLYVLKTNGLHDLDDRLYSPNITAYRQNQHEFNNPTKPIEVFNGSIYFGSEHRGLERVPLDTASARQDRPQQCNFGFGLPNSSPIGGEARCIINDNGWLATFYYNPSTRTSYLCYGIDYADVGYQRPALGGPLLWHGAEAVLPNVKVDFLLWHAPAGASFAPRLLIGGQDTATNLAKLYWLSLPQFGSPLQDVVLGGPMTFADEWVITYPRENWGNDAAVKDLTRVSIRGERLGTAALEVYAGQDGAAISETALGSSTHTYDAFPLAATEANDWTFRVKGRGTSTLPALLKSLEAQAGVTVESTPVLTYTVTWGIGTRLHGTMATDERDPLLVEAALLSLAGKRVTVRNERGKIGTARVLQPGFSVDWEETEGGERTYRAVATLPLMLLDANLFLDTGWNLDRNLRLV